MKGQMCTQLSFKFKFLEDISPLSETTDTLFGEVCPGFQNQVDPIGSMLHHLHVTESSDSSVVWHLRPHGGQHGSQAILIHKRANKL